MTKKAKPIKRKPVKRTVKAASARKAKPASIVKIEGNVSPAFKRAMLHKIAGHVLAVHDSKRKPVKLSKKLAKARDAARRKLAPKPLPASKVPNIAIVGEPDGYLWFVENKRTGKRVSKHKTYEAAWAARLKALRAERALMGYEKPHGNRYIVTNEDAD